MQHNHKQIKHIQGRRLVLFKTCRSRHCTMFTVWKVTRVNCGMPLTAMGIWQFPLRLTCLYTCKTSNICRTAAEPSLSLSLRSESEQKNTLLVC